ncbi:GNAT family N-acetyltransferase [Gordonia sp. VNQ95]|jgi:GNAT superfamily N-acetyltransferase|uniref:GNAT family N-acetyltransferase n=1 Tax=Gordonia sp. VNQ95 TaxID=3156619 RepID=UPI0032B602A1
MRATSDEVISESLAWRSSWHPQGSQHHRDGPFEFYVLEGEATLLHYHGGDTDPVRVLDSAAAVMARRGASSARITVGVGTFAGLDEDTLRRRGARTVAVVDIVALTLGDGADAAIVVPERITVRRVMTPDDVTEFADVSERAWGFPPHILAEPDFRIDDPHIRLFTASERGTAVGTGGYQLCGDVARFWGAAILPEHRGRGAYRALIAARLRDAHDVGARLALVHAEQTSSPILQRLGFVKYGERRLTWLPLP